ncbi:hypothetical protein [Nocardia sp. NPDC005825]
MSPVFDPFTLPNGGEETALQRRALRRYRTWLTTRAALADSVH